MKEDAVIEGFYKFLKDITLESDIDYPSEIDISTVTGTTIKFTDAKGNILGVIEPVKKENFNHGIQLRVDDQVLGLFISDEYIATAVAPTPVPIQQGGNPNSIVTLDSFKQLTIYTLEDLGLNFTEDGFLELDKGDNSPSSVGFVKQQLDELKKEILAMIPTTEDISKLSALPRGSIIVWTSKDIPAGWAICDGTNGTPDMRDKFIVGASNNRDINVTGGHATTSISLEGLEHYHGVGHNTNLRTDGDAGWGWNFSTNGIKDIPVSLMPSSNTKTKYYVKCHNNDQYHDNNHLLYVDTEDKLHKWDGESVNKVVEVTAENYDDANMITSGAFSGTMDRVTHWSNAGELTKELSVKSEPPFYSVYYIMKLTSSGAELDSINWDTEPTPGSINAVTSGGIYTYYETKLKAISDRIDTISGFIENLDTPAELSKAIAKLQAKVDKNYSGYENLVYAASRGAGTWTSVVGQEYPAYQLVGAVTDKYTEISGALTPTSTPYAIYKCIEPSTCTVVFQGVDNQGNASWGVEETPGKFEFVRWENE
jgi:hypothetical protein